jgi:hypothetical protein
VAPRGNSLKPVVLICAVPPNSGAGLPNTLSMTYLDSTGTNAAAFVQAQLVRVNRMTGARAVVATVASDSNSGTTTRKAGAALPAMLNFEDFYYFVRITMDRAAATQTVRSIGVALETIRS